MNLVAIQALEQAGFASWPAQYNFQDGQWYARLSPDLPFKRCNSLNCLNPQDNQYAAQRLEKMKALFRSRNLAPTIRLTPLTPPCWSELYQKRQWCMPFAHSYVMIQALNDQIQWPICSGQLEIYDRLTLPWLNSYCMLAGFNSFNTMAIQSALENIKPPVRFVRMLDRDMPVAVAVGVLKEHFIGLFGLAVRPDMRGQGYGWLMSLNIMNWGYSQGAANAWLQVEQANKKAVKLYTKLGFEKCYEYAYTRLIDN